MKKIFALPLSLVLFSFVFLGSVSYATDTAAPILYNEGTTTTRTAVDTDITTDRDLRAVDPDLTNDVGVTGETNMTTTDVAGTTVATQTSMVSLIISFILGAILGGFGAVSFTRKDNDDVKIESR